jgi:hypothetical protein
MVFLELSQVQSGSSCHIDSSVDRNEICSFSDTVDDYHDHIIAMSLG